MARFDDGRDLKDRDGKEVVRCSFCGTSWRDAKHLIPGPGVYICDECVELCSSIIEEKNKS